MIFEATKYIPASPPRNPSCIGDPRAKINGRAQSAAALLLLFLLSRVPAEANAACPNPSALGTSRILAVDPVQTPRVGLKSFPETLPLADKEVVLTFDDGPHPPTTRKILAALARECVQATFFLIGRNAGANASLVQQMAAQGHTIGHHTYSHRSLARIDLSSAIGEIDRGIEADDMALHGKSGPAPTTPSFRFPGFESTPALLEVLQKRRIAVFGADLWASDWNRMSKSEELRLITSRLAQARRGIILFHDTKSQTAAIMPDFLRYLRENHYRVVHIVPVAPSPP